MGQEENPRRDWGLASVFSQMHVSPERMGADAADLQRNREKRIAQAKAESLLADMHMPSDLRDFAARMGVPELANLIWTNGFLAGWRLAGRSTDDDGSAAMGG